MQNFDELKLPYALNAALRKIKFTTPTPIQAQAIPLALEGKDILGSAKTGSGKTGAFGIPLVAHLLNNAKGSALVLTPTRELAMQVMKVMQDLLCRSKSIKTALLIGGEPMGKQFAQLAARPRLIVGTPGRINDHLQNGKLMLHDAKFLVLDEMDRMLDMGFEVQLEEMFRYLPKERQTLMFSATLPDKIRKVSVKYLTFPERISVDEVSKPSENIDLKHQRVSRNGKYPTLLKELKAREGSIIVFVKTKRSCDEMAQKLYAEGVMARAIHGDLRQQQRNRVLQAFRKKKFRVLIATDVAARGLDVPHIEHVINYDLPMNPEDFIHRIGRTGRAGAKGEALCLITPGDEELWHEVLKLIDPEEAEKQAPPKKKPAAGHRGRSSNTGRGKKPGTKTSGAKKKKERVEKEPKEFQPKAKKPAKPATGKPASGKAQPMKRRKPANKAEKK